MKRTKSVLFLLLLIGLVSIPSITADTSQGLFWRFNTGDRAYYMFDVSSTTDEIHEVVYFEIDSSPPAIPDPLVNWSDMPDPSWSIYYEGGSTLGLEVLYLLWTLNFQLPTGNWSLLTTLADSTFSAPMIDFDSLAVDNLDPMIWGYTWIAHTDYYLYDAQTTYSKFDGFFQEHHFVLRNATSLDVVTTVDVSRLTQNLYWGYDIGDRFDFHLNLTSPMGTEVERDEDFYMTINSLPFIEYPIMDIFDFPFTDADYFWVNDTAEPSIESFFLYAFRPSYPLGNWSLFSDIYNDYVMFDSSTTDDSDPYFWVHTWVSYDSWRRYETTTEVLKVDGVVSRHHFVAYNDTSDEIVLTIEIERLGLEMYRDRTPPVLTHPDDIEFIVGSIGESIEWTANDANPMSYEVYLNGTLNATGAWTVDGEHFVHSLDGYEVGTYNLTIVVTDIAGYEISDTVIVTVLEVGVIPSFITDNLLYIGIGLAAVIIISAVVCRRRR